MTSSVAIEVALGLVFTYLVFSTLCSGISEAVSRFLNRRGSDLFGTVNALVGDAAAAKFWAHPQITGLLKSRNPSTKGTPVLASTGAQPAIIDNPLADNGAKVKKIAPSYIAPSTFASVLLDIGEVRRLLGGGDTSADPAATALPPAPDIPVLNAVLRAAGGDIERARADLEMWFIDSMQRLSGYYKRWTKQLLLALAFVVVLAFNVNTVHIAQVLWREPAVRAGVVQQARNPPASTSAPSSQQLQAAVNDALSLPVGWSSSTWRTDDWQWLWSIVGWLLTIGAVSLGAPFWFDLLTKLGSLRSSGPPPP